MAATGTDIADPGAPAVVRTELLVLGGGPGGYTAAFRAADLGRQVVLVDSRETLGGVCLNVGCIPSKALLHVAKSICDAEESKHFGVAFAPPTVDFTAVQAWKQSVVAGLTSGLTSLARSRKVKVIQGYGTFADANTVRVEGPSGQFRVSFDQAIIAAGSEPVSLPFVPNDDPRVLDSTGALGLEAVPQRLLVIGGGVIGFEMATVYSALGSMVTVVELMDQILPGADKDLVTPLHRRMEARLERILLKSRVTAVAPETEGLRVSIESPGGVSDELFDAVLVAVGRRPNGAKVGAENASVAVDGQGFVRVDAQMRTTAAHIFAVGDIVGNPMLAHKAVHEAKVAAEVACGAKAAFDARCIPSVAYTDPEVAWVGLTETEAKQQETVVEVGSFPWLASGRALSLGRSEGVTKLLFDRESGRVLGGGIVGANAGELIGEIALAIEMGANAGDIHLTIHPHPTLSETVALAAEVAEGTVTDLPPRKSRSK